MNIVDSQKRWWALALLCVGQLMIVLDITIVNVALPSIKADLGFSESSLVWVVNAYMIAFSGFLLLGGRLGDLFGYRKIFLIGLILFTCASLLCGIAQTQAFLVLSRIIQGLGGAVMGAVALSLIIQLFTEPAERAKAMGYFGFIAAGGGAIGVLLGGFLTGSFDWHWNFLINVPVGILVFLFCFRLLPSHKGDGQARHLDILGAVSITTSLMLAVYAIVGGNAAGWLSFRTLGSLGMAILLFLTFLFIEARVKEPLVPLRIFKERTILTVSFIGMMWSAGMFAWFFLEALYLQLVLGYQPLQVGLSFLAANLIMAAFSLGLSAKMVLRYGVKYPLVIGMLLITAGLFLFGLAPLDGIFVWHVLPGMILLGLGAGMAFNPVLLAGMSSVKPEEAGLASGVLNTAFMMGGALGLAILASLAAFRSEMLTTSGAQKLTALLEGYHLAFFVGSIFTFIAALLALRFIRDIQPPSDQANPHF